MYISTSETEIVLTKNKDAKIQKDFEVTPFPLTFSFGLNMSEIGNMSFSNSGILSTDGLFVPCRTMSTFTWSSSRTSKIAEMSEVSNRK